MTRTRLSPQLTKKQQSRLSDFNSEAEQRYAKQAAKNQAAMIRNIRKDIATWPEVWLARLNSEGIPPDGAPPVTLPVWRLVVDALRDLARAAESRDLQLEWLGKYLENLDHWARTKGEPHAAVCRIGDAWLKAFVDLPRAPLSRLRACRFCRRWFWDVSAARRQRYCPDRCRKKASEARLARRKSPQA
jgi:hypothetical protein